MMPLNMLSPSDIRPLAPAPVASTSGTTPNPKANEVIRIGRNRSRDASTAALRIGLPWTIRPSWAHLDDQNAVLGRQVNHQNEPDLGVKVVRDPEAGSMRRPAPTAPADPPAARRGQRSN